MNVSDPRADPSADRDDPPTFDLDYRFDDRDDPGEEHRRRDPHRLEQSVREAGNVPDFLGTVNHHDDAQREAQQSVLYSA